MFTGIISDVGKIVEIIQNDNKDLQLWISSKFDTENISIGASISCNGVCLTVIDKNTDSFKVSLSYETLRTSNFDSVKLGDMVNLERALKLGDEFGGHIVTGHIDTKASLINITKDADSYVLTFAIDTNFAYYVASKGSVTIEGISLTVNNADENSFTVNIIPFTWDNTNLKSLKIGSLVNIEIDILARYVERLSKKTK